MNKKLSLFLLATSLIVGLPSRTYASPNDQEGTIKSTLKLDTKSTKQIRGEDLDTKVRFDARQSPNNDVTLNIYLSKGRQITATLYRSQSTVSIRSFFPESNETFQLEKDDVSAFKRLLKLSAEPSQQIPFSPLYESFLDFLNYFSSASPGYTLNTTQGPGAPSSQPSSEDGSTPQSSYTTSTTLWTSRCSQVGDPATATYTLGSKLYSVPVQIGQCFIGEASGRCGSQAGPDWSVPL